MKIKIDLSQYNAVQLDYFYEYGIISHKEYLAELSARGFDTAKEYGCPPNQSFLDKILSTLGVKL